jgi:hypothetical protein
VITTQGSFFSRITARGYFPRNQLSSSGLEGDRAGKTSLRSVIGGAGKYEGARGSVLQHVTGSNVTEGPNFRFDFRLVDDD